MIQSSRAHMYIIMFVQSHLRSETQPRNGTLSSSLTRTPFQIEGRTIAPLSSILHGSAATAAFAEDPAGRLRLSSIQRTNRGTPVKSNSPHAMAYPPRVG